MPITHKFALKSRQLAAGIFTEPPRLHYMDWLRSTDMLFVLLIHSSLSFLPNASSLWPVRDVMASQEFNYLFSFIYIFNMPCFFFIAGFFASQIYFLKGMRYFLKNRIKRVVLPFVVVTFLLMLQHTVHWIGANFFTQLATATRAGIHFTNWQLLLRTIKAIPFPQFFDNTASYWFMYYLLMLYLVTLVIAKALAFFPLSEPIKKSEHYFSRITHSIWKPLLLALPAGFILVFFPLKFLPQCWYLAPPLSFQPDVGSLVYYGLFFWFGWLLKKQEILVKQLARYHWLYLGCALFITFPLTALLQTFAVNTTHAYYPLVKICALFIYPLGAWLFIFAMTGIFFHYYDKPNKIIRYLADASYWVYLTQVPVIFYLQEIFAPFAMFAGLKFLLIFSISGALLLLAYHRWVRFTIIGKTLNGIRYEKRWD